MEQHTCWLPRHFTIYPSALCCGGVIVLWWRDIEPDKQLGLMQEALQMLERAHSIRKVSNWPACSTWPR